VVLSRNYADAAAALSEHIERTLLTIYPAHTEEAIDSSSLAMEAN
jgi:hypothetical protein